VVRTPTTVPAGALSLTLKLSMLIVMSLSELAYNQIRQLKRGIFRIRSPSLAMVRDRAKWLRSAVLNYE
jgi:hypothetical protein